MQRSRSVTFSYLPYRLSSLDHTVQETAPVVPAAEAEVTPAAAEEATEAAAAEEPPTAVSIRFCIVRTLSFHFPICRLFFPVIANFPR